MTCCSLSAKQYKDQYDVDKEEFKEAVDYLRLTISELETKLRNFSPDSSSDELDEIFDEDTFREKAATFCTSQKRGYGTIETFGIMALESPYKKTYAEIRQTRKNLTDAFGQAYGESKDQERFASDLPKAVKDRLIDPTESEDPYSGNRTALIYLSKAWLEIFK